MKDRKSTLKKLKIQEKSSSKSSLIQNLKPFEQEIFKCPMSSQGCDSVFLGNYILLLNHLENECLYFISKCSKDLLSILQPTSYQSYQSYQSSTRRNSYTLTRQDLGNLLINKVNPTPTTESIQNEAFFLNHKPKTQNNLVLVKQDNKKRLNNLIGVSFKAIEEVKSYDQLDFQLGGVPFKSNMTCFYSLIKNKTIKNYVAYKSELNSITIKEVFTNTFLSKLEGHEDLITEIKFISYSNTKQASFNYLYSASLDKRLIIWDVDSLSIFKSLTYDSWILSSTISYSPSFDSLYVIIIGGYYKNEPIKVYTLKENQVNDYVINVKFDSIPEICCSSLSDKDENERKFLFIGTDSSKPMLVWMDFIKKEVISTYHLTSNASSISVDLVNIIVSDSSGCLKVIDIITRKILYEIKVNFPILDMEIWDNDHILLCGNTNKNSIHVLSRAKLKQVRVFENVHEKVVVNMKKMNVSTVGCCLLSIGGDKKVKISKII